MGKRRTTFVGEIQEEKKKARPERKGPAEVKVPGLKGGERVKLVAAEEIKLVKEEVEGLKPKGAGERHKKVRGERYKMARAKIETGKEYPIKDAIELAKSTHTGKFIGKIEAHLVLKSNLNTQIELPYSSGGSRRVEVASDETIKKLEKGVIDFDVLLATPAMMSKLTKYARILGPKGLFPNPKNGTIVDDPEKVKDKFGGNNVKLATEKDVPVLHVVVGKTDQKLEELAANLAAVMEEAKNKAGIRKVVVAATMGPGVRIEVG